jgi:hypothetical protein
MAFDADNFMPLSGMANSDAVRMWSYETDVDNNTAVQVATYFDDSKVSGVVEVGDVLLYKSTDETRLCNFTAVDNTAGAPDVTISTGVQIP